MDEELYQQASLEIVKLYPYLAYMLSNISEDGDINKVIDYIPENMMDYMMVDLEAERIASFSLMYNNSGYYELNIVFENFELGATFTYTFKITETLKDIICDCMEEIFGEPTKVDYRLNDRPQLTLLKGGKGD